jgi:hypothetical protein
MKMTHYRDPTVYRMREDGALVATGQRRYGAADALQDLRAAEDNLCDIGRGKGDAFELNSALSRVRAVMEWLERRARP